MDDLYDPLGLDRSRPQRWFRLRLIVPAGLGLFLLASLGFLHFFGNPTGGEPQAVAAISPEKPAELEVMPPKTNNGSVVDKGAPAQTMVEDAADIEQKSGVKIVRSGGGSTPDATIIEVPQPPSVALVPAPDPRLVEPSRYGPLPRIGADGARPADVYARPVMTSAAMKANAPRVAIVVGGLGLSQTATQTAIENLPGAVTLAFAPYGRDLDVSVSKARAKGHEVILQLPMEPIDYPQTNPGPHTLLSSASPAENTDNLHWLMSRFTGYIGVANFLGAKLTADAAALSPILREVAERGLIYADDGSSAQSLAVSLAPDAGLATAKADVVIDATPDGIDAALVNLESIARNKGLAIGMASALPASLEKIGGFARAAEAHGLVIIPLSAAVGKTAPVVSSEP
jgi:uncharacterized protein